MSALLQVLKESFRDNFASAIFLLVVGVIALAFIGYLVIDYVRMMKIVMHHKRRHPEDHPNENRPAK